MGWEWNVVRLAALQARLCTAARVTLFSRSNASVRCEAVRDARIARATVRDACFEVLTCCDSGADIQEVLDPRLRADDAYLWLRALLTNFDVMSTIWIMRS